MSRLVVAMDQKMVDSLNVLQKHFRLPSRVRVINKALALLKVASAWEDEDGSITLCRNGEKQKILINTKGAG